MSAFVVSKAHIDAMIRRGLALEHSGPLSWYAKDFRDMQEIGFEEMRKYYRTLTDETADQVGQMLIDECVKSVSYRYQDDKLTNLPGPINAYWLIPYQYQISWGARIPNPVETLKLISCYDYQSCEHPGWHDSEAKRFCEALTHWMISMLPGYDDAPWEWRELSEALAPTPPDPEGRMKSPYDFPLSKTEIEMAEARSMAPTPPMKLTAKQSAELKGTLPSAGDMFINLGDGTIRHITVHLGKDGDWYTGTLLLDAYLKSIVNEVTWETEEGPTPPALSEDEMAIPGFGETFERCVLDTKAKGGAINPYAVCRSALRRSHGLPVGSKN